MLVISRQRDERLMIGNDIVITVVDIKGGKVKLGIDAPDKVRVHREEIYQRIKAEHRKGGGGESQAR